MATDRDEYIRVRVVAAWSCVEQAAKMIRELVSGEYADMAGEAIALENIADSLKNTAESL